MLSAHTINPQSTATGSTDVELLPAVVEIMQETGKHLVDAFSKAARPVDMADITAALEANDTLAVRQTRQALLRLRPGSGWVEDELATGLLPAGEWWVSDPVEGNINHVHGLGEWATTATLIRDNTPVLTVVHDPLWRDTYTAVRGHGSHLNGQAIRTSAKTDLAAAAVATGQAMPGEGAQTYRRIGQSATAMLERSLLLRVAVPATLLLTRVACGQLDAFWQYSQVRSGLAPGALLVTEAGGTVTDTHGRPWTLASEDFLAAAPGLHSAAAEVLASIA